MKRVTVEQIARDEENVSFEPGDSYLTAYPEFLSYFSDLEVVTRHSFIIGAHFVYGWMPTVLTLGMQDCDSTIAVLNQVKSGCSIGVSELRLLRRTINNSVVGTSKLLHFMNPRVYAIWDGRVCAYVYGRRSPHQVGKVSNYLDYLEKCREITSDERFTRVHRSINRKLREYGYEVSPFRAVELVMWKNGQAQIAARRSTASRGEP